MGNLEMPNINTPKTPEENSPLESEDVEKSVENREIPEEFRAPLSEENIHDIEQMAASAIAQAEEEQQISAGEAQESNEMQDVPHSEGFLQRFSEGIRPKIRQIIMGALLTTASTGVMADHYGYGQYRNNQSGGPITRIIVGAIEGALDQVHREVHGIYGGGYHQYPGYGYRGRYSAGGPGRIYPGGIYRNPYTGATVVNPHIVTPHTVPSGYPSR